MELSKSVLEWREGDEITSEHRDAMAAHMARAFNLSPEDEAKTREEFATIPVAVFVDGFAVMIAQELRMDANTFRQSFPSIAREAKSYSVREYLRVADQLADRQPDLRQIG